MATPEEMAQSMIANMEAKTGKPLDAWLKHVSTLNLAKHGEIVKHLKSEHDVTHGFANLIAHSALKSAAAFPKAIWSPPSMPARKPICDRSMTGWPTWLRAWVTMSSWRPRKPMSASGEKNSSRFSSPPPRPGWMLASI